MADTNRDSQDSETSSTSSWSLLTQEEALQDMVTLENQEVFFKEVSRRFSEIDSKNNQSDIESDGISIISESEFSQNENRSDEDAVIISEGEIVDIADDPLKNIQLHLEEQETVENLSKNILEQQEKTSIDNNNLFPCSSEINNQVDHVCSQVNIVDQETSLQMSILNCLKNYIRTHDYKVLLTSPSLICTSVLIIAVLIFPCTFSRDGKVGAMKDRNVQEIDRDTLSGKKDSEFDFTANYREIQNNHDLFDDHQIRKLMKRNMKEMKRLKKNHFSADSNPNIELNFKKRNKAIEIGEEGMSDQKMYKKITKKYKNRKYKKKYCDTGECHYGEKKKNVNLPEWAKSDIKAFENLDEIEARYKARLFEMKLNKWMAELYEKEKTLLKKENFLNAWENQLLKREKYIRKEEIQKTKDDSSYVKKKSEGKSSKLGMKKWKHKYKDSLNDKNFKNKSAEILKKFKKVILTKDHLERKPEESDDSKRKKTKKFLAENYLSTVFLNEIDGVENISSIENNDFMFPKDINNVKKNISKISEIDDVLTGQWYIDFVRARQDIRKKEQKASWWFDRAEYRKNKRNKAYWYFQYMFNREHLRYRHKSM